MKHLLEIDINAEGNKLAILSPLNKDGEPECGYRIAGPRTWGGSTNIARLEISDRDLIEYINSYASHIKKQLD